MFWRANLILRVHTYLLSWQKTNFFHHIDTLTKINVKIDKCELPTFYWLPKLHKNPFKSRLISNFIHCFTAILPKHITSALTSIKDHVIKYSENALSNSNVNYLWSIKDSSKAIGKLLLSRFSSIFFRLFDFIHLITTWSYQRKRVVSC